MKLMEEDLKPGVNQKAILASVMGIFFLSLVGVFVKLQESAGATIEWIVFVQYSTCLIAITKIYLFNAKLLNNRI